MSGTVPQFPGKGGVPSSAGKPGPTQPVPGWQKAICPFLTAGEMARTPLPTLVGLPQLPAKAQACLGPQCMLFIAMKRADGSEQAGCAPVQAVGQLIGLNMMVSEFIMAAKAGAAAEAAATNEPADDIPSPAPTVPGGSAAPAVVPVPSPASPEGT